MTPEAVLTDFKPMLEGMSGARLLAYPKHTSVAEKLEAMVKLGLTNSRMNDLHDLWVLAQDFGFDGDVLSGAVANTFGHRGTPIPSRLPPGLTPAFLGDKEKQALWNAFLGRTGLEGMPPLLSGLEPLLVSFLWPVLQAAEGGQENEP